jgi:hypothetical protein
MMTDAATSVRTSWLARTLSRTSSRVCAAALAVGLAALALTLHQRQLQRDFSEPTTITMGVVLRKGGRPISNESFCWVSYEFTPAGGAPQRNWRLWQPACGVSRGRPIPIQYVIARPEVNRPAGEAWSFPPLLVWFAAGVMLVVGFLLRRSEEGA